MGGSGSGNYGRRSSYSLTSSARALTIAELVRAASPGDLAAGSLLVSDVGPWPSRSERIAVSWTLQPTGGWRWWFLCPLCARRCAILYRPGWFGGSLGCRTCHGLTYRSQYLTRARRLSYRAGRLLQRAGIQSDDAMYYRPPRMHWRTFHRLCERADALEEASAEAALGSFLRVCEKWQAARGV